MPFPLLNIAALPIRTNRTLRAVPYVTYTLCFANLIVYLAHLHLSEYQLYQFNQQWGFTVSHPSLVTLFTHAFLHSDLFHLIGNLLILWLVGTVLEAGIGSPLFLLLYLAGQVAAILLYGMIAQVFMPDSLNVPLIGASGAISGVTGLAAFRYFRLRVLTVPMVAFTWFPMAIPLPLPFWVPLWAYAAIFAVREVLDGLLTIETHHHDAVAHWAHIGGLALGALAAVLMQVAHDGKRESVLEDSARAAAGEAPKEQSRRDVEDLLRQRPEDPEALEAMAALLLVQGQHQHSRDHYLRALPLFLADGRRERAAISYLNALHAFPDTVLPLRDQMLLASTLETLGHFPEAARAFQLLAETYPEQEEAQTALLRCAYLYQRRLSNPGKAFELLHSLLDTYPNSPWCTLARERLREVGQ